MNKVTQSIYQKKVDDLENEVSELLDKPQPHLYVFLFGSTYLQNITVFIHTTAEIPLTLSAMYDYIFEATKYHNGARYSLPLSGFYSDTTSSSETYGKWLASQVGAMEAYPGATVTDLNFSFIKTGEPGAILNKRLTKEYLSTLNYKIIKVY